MSQSKDLSKASILDPNERLKLLINYSNTIEVDPHVPVKRYYRSGLEMVRMANVYHKEGSLENAYVLYLKFMTLFLEKVRTHPGFNTVPPETKAANQVKLREILPKAEKLKQELLKQYQKEYDKYQLELKIKEKQKKDQIPKKLPVTPAVKENSSLNSFNDSQSSNFDDISYPDPNVSLNSLSFVDNDKTKKPSCVNSIPSIDRSTKPSEMSLDNIVKNGLRSVIVPSTLMSQFLSRASKSTARNIETCGILAGKLEKNELIITHMILPKQKGTPDSCTTMNEEEFFDYQDQHNLITIGWIHTHPTQTSFLSSVDLHTHCPYQLLMPEAIAIVCAPRYNETGFYVLTPHYGLQFIADCRKSGFHPHPTEPPLFMTAEHVKIENNAPLQVLDLRTE